MADTIKHRHQTAVAPTGADVDNNEWNDSHIMSGGVDGQLMTRNSGAADGWAWANAPSSGWQMAGASVATDESTTSSAYADLATAGPSVTVTLTGATVILWISVQLHQASAGNTAWISVDVSGANTIAASDANSCLISCYAGGFNLNTGRNLMLTGLAAGSTTFKLRYRRDGSTWFFFNRSIAIAYT